MYRHPEEFHSFRAVPRTGVIYVMSKARELGFYYGHKDWSNLGQGAPEIGPIPDSPKRIETIQVPLSAYEYGPVAGIPELREAVANLYNQRYRRGMVSQYSAENVSICAGGRVGLTRIAAALSSVNLGHFLPDYTAYEELLDLFRDFVPIPILLDQKNGFCPGPDLLRSQVVGMGLGAVLISNPCNPTGQVLHGDNLASWIDAARELQCIAIFDEFYSHYLYEDVADQGLSNSAAAFVEDVNKDPVVIIDGLTKNWRYPGLRLSWTVGPRNVIRQLASAGSFLDGGAPHAVQRMAIPLLDIEHAKAEALAIQSHFGQKRRTMLERIQKMGMKIYAIPKGSFYCFVSLEDLPGPLQDSLDFFRAVVERRVICVPGIFFDVNPGKRRSHIPSRLSKFVRLSFGPPMDEIEKGLNRFEALIQSFR